MGNQATEVAWMKNKKLKTEQYFNMFLFEWILSDL